MKSLFILRSSKFLAVRKVVVTSWSGVLKKLSSKTCLRCEDFSIPTELTGGQLVAGKYLKVPPRLAPRSISIEHMDLQRRNLQSELKQKKEVFCRLPRSGCAGLMFFSSSSGGWGIRTPTRLPTHKHMLLLRSISCFISACVC